MTKIQIAPMTEFRTYVDPFTGIETKYRLASVDWLGEKGYSLTGTVEVEGHTAEIDAEAYKSGPTYRKPVDFKVDNELRDRVGFGLAEILANAVAHEAETRAAESGLEVPLDGDGVPDFSFENNTASF